MLARVPRVALVGLVVSLFGISGALSKAQAPEQSSNRPISFFIFPPGFSGARVGDDAVHAQFQEIVEHLGQRSSYGSVGVALNYPYLTFVTGKGARKFCGRSGSNQVLRS